MTRLWMTGFEACNAEIFDVGAGGVTISDVAKRSGEWGMSLAYNVTAQTYQEKILPSAHNYTYVRIYIKRAGSAAAEAFLQLMDADGDPHLRFDVNGGIFRWNGTAWVDTTYTFTAVSTSWTRFEVYVYLNALGSTFVRINGTEVTAMEGVNNLGGNAGTNPEVGRIRLGKHSTTSRSGLTVYFDDIAVTYDSGPYDYGNWPGPGAILGVFADGPGRYSEFSPTPSGNDNYECIKEQFPDDDIFVTSNLTGSKDLYDMESLVTKYGIPSLAQVTAVALNARVQVPLSGDAELTPLIYYSEMEAEGDPIALPNTGNADWQFVQGIWEVNPTNLEEFTAVAVSVSQFGYKA